MSLRGLLESNGREIVTITETPIIWNDSPTTLGEWLSWSDAFFIKSEYECHEDYAAELLSDLEMYNDDISAEVSDMIGEHCEQLWDAEDCEDDDE